MISRKILGNTQVLAAGNVEINYILKYITIENCNFKL